jgi:hypothetical protein
MVYAFLISSEFEIPYNYDYITSNTIVVKLLLFNVYPRREGNTMNRRCKDLILMVIRPLTFQESNCPSNQSL